MECLFRRNIYRHCSVSASLGVKIYFPNIAIPIHRNSYKKYLYIFFILFYVHLRVDFTVWLTLGICPNFTWTIFKLSLQLTHFLRIFQNIIHIITKMEEYRGQRPKPHKINRVLLAAFRRLNPTFWMG